MTKTSIQHNLGATFHRTVTLCLFVSCLGFGTALMFTTYKSFTTELLSVSQVVAATSRASLIFNDVESANRILSGLSENKSVQNAALIFSDGRVLTKRNNDSMGAFQLEEQAHQSLSWTLSSLRVMTPIAKDEELLGFLVIDSSLGLLYTHAFYAVLITLLFALLAAVGSSYFRRRLQTEVLEPIVLLRDSTAQISITQSFPEDVHIPERENDELRELFFSFRTMLLQLKERDRALTLAKDRAEEADRLKSIFLATVSHELRTPLHAILGMTDEVLLSHVDSEQRELLEIVRNSGRHLISIINDILDFSKMEAGRLILIPGPTELRTFVPETLKLFELAAKKKGVALQMEISPDVPEVVNIDGARLAQILINLVGNALKFTLSGKIQVSIRKKEGGKDPKAVMLQISISDTGIGIPKEHLGKIFDSFNQIRSNSPNEGAGLGLAISSKLVGLMQGWIWAESEVGTGSTFSFVVPGQLAAPVVGQAGIPHADSKASVLFETPREMSESTMKRILVVEDNRVNAKLADRIIRQAGYDVLIALDGQDCLNILVEQDVDLILMDIQMPVMDGITATKHIREREKVTGKRTPIIALTANALDDQIEECFSVGMDEYMTKPLDRKSLLQVIAKFLPASAPRQHVTH